MAEQTQDNKSAAQTAASTVTNVKDAAKMFKDVGRVAAGDLTAVKELLTNQVVWLTLLIIVLIICMVGMVIGVSITGVINFIAESWQKNWEENWTDQAIESDGDLQYLQTTGWVLTLTNTIDDVLTDIYNAVTTGGIAAGAGTSDNQQIDDAEIQEAGNNPDETDYETTMQAIMDEAMLDQALTDRLDMIKGRVKQRGLQIKNAAFMQYIFNKNSELNKMAELLAEEAGNEQQTTEDGTVILYAGFSQELSDENFNFDLSAFELSSLQALKILAMFSIQNDCQLSEIDIWSLMDYCGWFLPGSEGELKDTPDSIYDVVIQDQRFGTDIGNSIQAGQSIPIATYEFSPLEVPVWTGTCAPQWYYEELAQIRKHNQEYLQYKQRGDIPDNMILWGMQEQIDSSTTYSIPGTEILSGYAVDLQETQFVYIYTYKLYRDGTELVETVVDPPAGENLTFTNLEPDTSYSVTLTCTYKTILDGEESSSYVTESIVLKNFKTESTAPTVSMADDIQIEAFEELRTTDTFGIIDRLYYSTENNLTVNRSEYSSTGNFTREEIEGISEEVAEYWEEHVWGREKTTISGNTVARDDAGVHSYTYAGIIPSGLETVTIDPITGGKFVSTDICRLALYDSQMHLIAIKDQSSENLTFSDLAAETNYTVSLITTTITVSYDKDGTATGTYATTASSILDLFTTFEDIQPAVAYQLYISVNLSFQARTVDELAIDLLGIWPGSLDNTTQVCRETAAGNLIGKSTDEGEKYTYCLKRTGVCELIDSTNEPGIILPIYDRMKLQRTTTSTGDEFPITTATTIYEYGVAGSNGLASVSDTPQSGWKTVNANGDHLIFEIDGQAHYKVYARITKTINVLNSDGTTTKTVMRYLYCIDEIKPERQSYKDTVDTEVSNGKIYAADHLGNEDLLLNWTDTYETEDGTRYKLSFSRMTGYQYESYVDMVMALCELLEIPYDDWDPALKRIEDLDLKWPK